MKGSSNTSISSPAKMRKDISIQTSSNGSVASHQQHQQRLYVAPQSTIRAPDCETTSTLTQQIDTKTRRRRTNNNFAAGGGGALHNSFDAVISTSYSPQSSPSEKSTTRYVGNSAKAKKKKKVFLNSSFHQNYNNSNHNYHDSDDSSSSEDVNDDDSILGNVSTPCLWMDDIEGNVIPTKHNVPRKALNSDSRQRKSSRKLPSTSNRSTSRNYNSKSSIKNSSNSSVQSESKYNRCHNGGGDDNDDDDHQSVHTYHTIHSLQHEVQSKLIVDLGGGCGTPFLERKDSNLNAKKYYATGQKQRPILKNTTGRSNKGNYTDEKNRLTRCLVPLVRGLVLLLFLFVVYDSRQRSTQHQQQLLMLDEERAHILEQMTWIDGAAKKVHKKYSTMATKTPSIFEVSEENGKDRIDAQHYKEETIRLQADLDTIQLRVQQNARTRTSIQFGDEPVQVSLPISEGSVTNEHYVIALSDDAPHAVNTFLQQVSIGLWNEIDFQQMQNGRVIQASTRFSDTKPMLEFVEKSRGCHQAGSVALHQLESDDFHVMVLKIHMDAAATVDVDDVCIGNVVKGFDLLQTILSQLPTIEVRNAPKTTIRE